MMSSLFDHLFIMNTEKAKIILVEVGMFLQNANQIAEAFNDFFCVAFIQW